jgi:hypothetical protein
VNNPAHKQFQQSFFLLNKWLSGLVGDRLISYGYTVYNPDAMIHHALHLSLPVGKTEAGLLGYPIGRLKKTTDLRPIFSLKVHFKNGTSLSALCTNWKQPKLTFSVGDLLISVPEYGFKTMGSPYPHATRRSHARPEGWFYCLARGHK